MTYYPMRKGILKIQFSQRKDSERARCADAAQWIWSRAAWPMQSMYRMYSASGIIEAQKSLSEN